MKRFFIYLFLIHCGFLVSAEHPSKEERTAMLYIVRHGQTDWNVEKRIQGHTDIPLNDVGRAQAVELKEKLKDVDFAFCFSSDLQRAIETARILSEKSSIDVQLDQRLRERNFGPWEGCLSSEYNNSLNEHGMGVESDEMVQSRVFACLEEIAGLPPQANILIATHGGVMRNVIAKLCSLRASEIQVENMALLKLKMSDKGMEIVEMQGIGVPFLQSHNVP